MMYEKADKHVIEANIINTGRRTDICNCLLGNVSSAAIVCKLLIPYHFEKAKQYLGGYVNKIWKIFANVEIGNVEIGWNGYKLIK